MAAGRQRLLWLQAVCTSDTTTKLAGLRDSIVPFGLCQHCVIISIRSRNLHSGNHVPHIKYLRLGLVRLGHVRMTLIMSPCMQWDHRHHGRLSYSIIYSTIKLIAIPKGGASLCQTPEQKRLRPQNCTILRKRTAMVFSSSTKPRASTYWQFPRMSPALPRQSSLQSQ